MADRLDNHLVTERDIADDHIELRQRPRRSFKGSMSKLDRRKQRASNASAYIVALDRDVGV
jgi:hypothetical protein